jgi:parallel beta-helix repeat protein
MLVAYIHDNGMPFAFLKSRNFKKEDAMNKRITILMVAAAMLLSAAQIAAKILYVDVTGSKDYSTISEAMLYAMPGDIVFVCNGVYKQEKLPLQLNDHITLLGENFEQAIIDAKDNGKPAIQVIGKTGVTIKSLTIRNAGIGIEVKGNADSLTIDRCFLVDNGTHNIKIKDCRRATIISCVVLGAKNGIWLKNAENVRIYKNTMVGSLSQAKNMGLVADNSPADVKYNLVDRYDIGIKAESVEPAMTILFNNFHYCRQPYWDKLNRTVVFVAPGTDEGNTQEDPLFVDLRTGNLRLQENSPCASLGAYTDSREPVSLFQFKGARKDKHSASLVWLTSSEKNNRGWNVYRGMSPEGPYIRVNEGLVLGAGTSQIFNEYTFVDKNIPDTTPTLYYYLEQVDFDKNTTYSPQITLMFNIDGSRAATNYSGNSQYPDLP